MRIWWRLTSFAVGDGTVAAMVCQIWHEPLVNLSRHHKTGSKFFGEQHQLGYRWHCVSSLSLMILHTSFLAFCCTSTSTSTSAYKRNKVTISSDMYYILYVTTYIAKVNIMVIIQRWSEYNTNVLEYEYDYFEHAWVWVLRKQMYSSKITLECTRVRVRLL